MSILTGLTSGVFDSLRVKNPSSGQYESVFPGGGGSADLSAYSTTTQVLSFIASSLSPYATSTQTNLHIANVVSTALTAYATSTEVDAAIAQALQAYVTSASLNAQLGSYVLTSTMTAALASKLDTLTASGIAQISGTGATRNIHVPNHPDLGAYALTSALESKLDTLVGNGCSITGTGSARTITVAAPDLSAYATTASLETYATLSYVQANFLSPLTGPSFTVGAGLTASLTANSVALSLNFTEVRPSLSLVDTNNAVKQLTFSGGELVWGGAPMATQAFLAGYAEPAFTAVAPLQKSVNLGNGTIELKLTQAYQDSKQDTLTSSSNISVDTLTTRALTASSGQVWFTGPTHSQMELVAASTSYFSYIDFSVPNIDYRGRILYNHSSDSFAVSVGVTTTALNITSTGLEANAYNSFSDLALKENIEAVDPALCSQIVSSVNPKTYTRNDLGTGYRAGFVAQDIDAVIPAKMRNIVGETEEDTGNGDSRTLKTVDYSRLSAILWGCCQDLMHRVDALAARVDALELAQ